MKMNPAFIDGCSFTLKDVKVKWVNLAKPDAYEGREFWKITAILEQGLAFSMKEAGLLVKKEAATEDDPECYHITPKCYVKTKIGENDRPPVTDENGDDLNPKIVGSGSTCDISVYAKYKKVGGKMNCPIYLNGVKVIDLVEYIPADSKEASDLFGNPESDQIPEDNSPADAGEDFPF